MDQQNGSGARGGAVTPERMFLTAEEVGAQLGLRRSRVYELAAAGLLPVVRLGKRMLFPRRGLDQLADEAIARVREELSRADGAWIPSTLSRRRPAALASVRRTA